MARYINIIYLSIFLIMEVVVTYKSFSVQFNQKFWQTFFQETSPVPGLTVNIVLQPACRVNISLGSPTAESGSDRFPGKSDRSFRLLTSTSVLQTFFTEPKKKLILVKISGLRM